MIVSKDGNKKMTFKFLKFNHNKWLKIKTWTNHKLKIIYHRHSHIEFKNIYMSIYIY